MPLSQGEQTFKVTQTDPAGNESDPVAVTITVDTTKPAPPVITAPSDGQRTGSRPTFEGTGEPGAEIKVYDEDGNVVCTTTVNPDGTWSCRPDDPLPDGEQTFKVTQTDEAGNESDPATVTIIVDSTNQPPVAVDDTLSVPESIPTHLSSVLDVLDNDTDPNDDDLTIVAVSAPAHGVATTNGATIIYTPTTGYLGPDAFTYTVSDGASVDSAQVTVTVLPVADLAVAQTVRGTISGLEFTLVARNLGPRPANGAVISDTFPPSLGNITWTCVGTGGAVCPNASGTGHIEETLATFPANGVVTYTVSAQFVLLSIIENNTVTITPPAGMFDLVMSNNTATRLTLYRIILPLVFRNATP